MRRFTIGLVAIAMVSFAADPPADFSGVWKMDPSRSESAHQSVAVGPVTLLITQNAAELTIETKTGERDKAAIANESLTYKLDGSENSVAGESGVPVKSKAHWDGAKLVAETTRNVKDSTVTTKYVYSLNPGGAEMAVDKTLTVQHGYQFQGANNIGTGKDVFVKQKAPVRQK
jgi:ribosomal protein L27